MKTIKNNIFGSMTSICLNIVSKQLQFTSILFLFFESLIQSQIIIKYKTDTSNAQKYYSL